MTEKAICVCFCTSDMGFGQIVCSALGPGFEVGVVNESDISCSPGQVSEYDGVLVDLRSTGITGGTEAGLRLMDEIRQTDFPPPLIILVENDNPALTRKLIEAGAYDTLFNPLNIVELRLVLRHASRLHQIENELQRMRSEQLVANGLAGLVGFGQNIEETFDLIRKVAPSDLSVLITGETGTGKSMLARAIHNLSPRSSGPFVSFSCANLQENLIEAELFGHEKGAFTGAVALRRGRFEAAEGGTLFFDEVGDLPLGLQAKLLRVLHERTFERLGSNKPLTVDIRPVWATHRNLEEMVKRGEFREDLYYRLNVFHLHLPPLRERVGGVVSLAHHFLESFSPPIRGKAYRFSHRALQAMEEHRWPGNVRELENVVQRALVLADGATIETWHLPENLRNGFDQPRTGESYEEEVRNFRRRLIGRKLRECGGNKAETARVLGLARGYLHRLINELSIQPEETCPGADGADEKLISNRIM